MSNDIPEWITNLALDIYRLIQKYDALAPFQEKVREWAIGHEAEVNRHLEWRRQRNLHFEQTVNSDPRLQDEKSGPPDEGWEWEIQPLNISPQIDPDTKLPIKIVRAWVPPELSGDSQSDIKHILPLSREQQLSLTEKYTLLAAIYDFGRKGTDQIPPWDWTDLNTDVSSDELADVKKCLFFESLCGTASSLRQGDEGWLRAFLDDVENDLRKNVETDPDTKSEREGTIERHKPWYKKIWVLILGVAVLLGAILALIQIYESETCKNIINSLKRKPSAWTLNHISNGTIEPVSLTNTDMAKRIVLEYFQLNDDSISKFNAVWCDLASNGKSSEFYATYYHNQFTKYLTVFTTRGNVPENLFHRTSKGGYSLRGEHALINDVTYFLCATRVGSGGYLDLYVFQYDGINKLERVHTEASLFQGNLWVINNQIFLAGGNHRYELSYISDGFTLLDYDKRVQYLEDSASHVLAYHIDGIDFKITYDGKPIQFTLMGDYYTNNEPITLAMGEQIIEDDNIIGVEPQQIRLLSKRGEFEYRPGFFFSLIPTSVGLKELNISFNYETWYHIKVLVENN